MYNFTLNIDVFDEALLWQKAYALFEEQNGTIDQADFEHVHGTQSEVNVTSCIQTLMDPGDGTNGYQGRLNDAGIQINYSDCDKV